MQVGPGHGRLLHGSSWTLAGSRRPLHVAVPTHYATTRVEISAPNPEHEHGKDS